MTAMADFKIKFDTQRFERLIRKLEAITKNFIDGATAEKLGAACIYEMKRLITVGKSPIKGTGKFPPYKNKKKYPGDRKPGTPVNLKLSGDFLNSLRSKMVSNPKGINSVKIYFDSEESVNKELGHRQGANGQPKRPIMLDQKAGEKLDAKINATLVRILKGRLKELLK
jgi:hypothetical protein